MAIISAGWQEAEGDIDDIFEQVQRPLHDLGLYQKAEQLTATYPRFVQAYRARQDDLKDLQRLYRLRCKQLMIATRATLQAEASPNILEAEQNHAISQIHELDRHHLQRLLSLVNRIHDSSGIWNV